METHSPKTIVLYTLNSWDSPLAMLRILGPAQHAGITVIHGNDGGKIFPEKVSQAEMVVIQRDFARHGKAYDKILRLARSEGKPVIIDLDDLLLELPEDHPDRITHYYSNALLPMIRGIIEANGVTVTTPSLRDYIRPFNPNVWLLPNYLNDRIWNLRPPRPPNTEHQPVVIGYMGGDSHMPDLKFVAPALLNILRRFGDRVEIRFLGARPPVDLSAEPNVQWTPSKTLNYANFATDFLNQDYDIFIAPLQDNLFNRCKSSIKFLEYSALGVPGVYSHLPPYSDVVHHGENGYLVSTIVEWEEYLTRLIKSPSLRQEIAKKAQETVQKNWLLSQYALEWVEVYTQALTTEPIPIKARPPEIGSILRIARQTQDYQRTQKAFEQSHIDQIAEKQQEIEKLKQEIDTLKQEAQNLTLQLTQTELDRDSFSQQLWAIEHSQAWKVILRYRELRSRITRPASLLAYIWHTGRQLLKRLTIWLVKPAAIVTKETEPDPEETIPKTTKSQNLTEPTIELEGLPQDVRELEKKHTPSKFDIILLPVMDWESRVQRPQQLALQFARAGYRVFYLHPYFRQQPTPLVKRVHENIYEVRLPSPKPVNLYQETMDKLLVENLATAFSALRNTFGIIHAVCLVDLPFWAPLALHLRREYGWKIIYDCMDYHKGFSTNADIMLHQEDNLVAESDMVLATSHLLMAEKSTQNANCVRVPNGADFDHFHFPVLGTPPELSQVARPIIGYYGAIADWFDSDLVRILALTHPEWNFVLVGSTLYADLEPLKSLPNILLFGEIPYRSLPPYLHSFDVAIIPFKRTSLTEATNPVKLFEYLSAGKAVVATDLDELRHYAEYARLASTPEQWLSAIEVSLDDYSPECVQARLEFARHNTWELRFTQVETSILDLYPKISIIILTYNNLDYTRLCLNSILEKTRYPNYEIILVDNASTDNTPEFLGDFASAHNNVKLILNTANEGFARGNNIGASAATGETLVFLNNDTVVTYGWLSGLIEHLQDFDVGMVGPVTNWSGNESRITVDYITLDDLDEFAARQTASHKGQSFEINMLAFLCVAIHRSVFEEVGPLDEAFGIGMFEDDDYALRLRSRGYRLICAKDVFIHHWGQASFSKLAQETYQTLFEENRRKFEAKWGTNWEQHQYRQ